FVDLAAKEGGELDDLLGLCDAVALLDGDVGGAAALQEVGHFLLRLATSFSGLGDPLPKNPGINRFKLRHGPLLPFWVRAWRGASPSCTPSLVFPRRWPSTRPDTVRAVRSRPPATVPAPGSRCLSDVWQRRAAVSFRCPRP